MAEAHNLQRESDIFSFQELTEIKSILTSPDMSKKDLSRLRSFFQTDSVSQDGSVLDVKEFKKIVTEKLVMLAYLLGSD